MYRNTTVDPNEKAYRALVESTLSTLPCETASLEEIYAHFGLSHDMSFSQRHVTDHLYAQIALALRSHPANAKNSLQLKTLKHHLLLRHFADGEALQPYLTLLDVIMDATRTNGWSAPPLSDELSWRTALTAAANYDVICPNTFSHPDAMVPRLNQRQHSVAGAIIKLRGFGYKVEIAAGQANIKDEEQLRISERIESQIRRAGGLQMAASVFHSLRRSYEPTQERYHTVRRTSTIGRDGGPSLPVAYLLNLCVKNTAAPSSNAPQAEAAVKDALMVATAYAATFDLEPYNTFETLFHSGSKLPHFLREIATYDGMFNVAQARPSSVEKVLRGLFDWLDDIAAIRDLGWTINQAARLARGILKLSRGVHGPFFFTRNDLAAWMPGLPKSILAAILSVFSHQIGVANREYRLPHEQTKVDFWFKPLIEQAPGQYVLMDRSWCAPAFYEAVADAVRKRTRDSDSRVGLALERLVKAELEAHGVHVMSGTYSIGGQDGECDAVIETTDHIIFIEMKKKPFTRQSRGGSDVDLFYDLSESLLAAQYQIGKHELLLYRHGVLELHDGATVHRIERNGRSVERMALSPVDFGAIQDRGVISQILETLMTFRLGAIDPKNADRIGRVQKKGDVLLKQYDDLTKLRPQPRGPAFMNYWFLSLGQLLVILEGVSSNDSFQKSLFTTRHAVMGSLDFYFEHAQILALKASQSP